MVLYYCCTSVSASVFYRTAKPCCCFFTLATCFVIPSSGTTLFVAEYVSALIVGLPYLHIWVGYYTIHVKTIPR